MAIEKRITNRAQPVKDNAALHGADIGYIYKAGIVLHVNLDEEHDGWVPIVGPGDLGPNYKGKGKRGWVKLDRTNKLNEQTTVYQLVLDADGGVVSCTRVG